MTFVLGALFPIHEFTFRIGDWTIGVEEYSNFPQRTRIHFGPTSIDVLDVTAYQVLGAAGLVVAVLIALAVILADRRGSRRQLPETTWLVPVTRSFGLSSSELRSIGNLSSDSG